MSEGSLCPGKKENGESCGFTIGKNNFCPQCRLKINQLQIKDDSHNSEGPKDDATKSFQTVDHSKDLSSDERGLPDEDEVKKLDDEATLSDKKENLSDETISEGKSNEGAVTSDPKKMEEDQVDQNLAPSNEKTEKSEGDSNGCEEGLKPNEESGDQNLAASHEENKKKDDVGHDKCTGDDKVTSADENKEKADVRLGKKSVDKILVPSDEKTEEERKIRNEKGGGDNKEPTPDETQKAEMELRGSENENLNQSNVTEKEKKDESHSRGDDAATSLKENCLKDTSKNSKSGSVNTDKKQNNNNQGTTSDVNKGNGGKTQGSAQKPGVSDRINVKPKDRFTVRFHVVFPMHEFGSNSWNDDLVKLEIDHFLKKNNLLHMQFKREIDTGMLLLMQEVVFAKEELINKSVKYKYVVKNCETNKSDDCYPKPRYLYFSSEMLKYSEWNQYDCFAPKNKEHVSLEKKAFKMFTKFFVGKTASDVSKEDFISSQYYSLFPRWKELEIDDKKGPGETYLIKFDAVYRCAKKALNDLDMDICSLEKLAKKGMQKYIVKDSNETDILARTCCVLYILMKYELFEREQMSESLCQKLLIDSSVKNYEYFCKAFPGDNRKKEIAQVLLSFLKKIVTKDFIDPSWLMVIPFLHLLKGKVKPLQILKIERNHSNDKWWGLEEISDLVNIHKKFVSDDKGLVKKMCLDQLGTLFEVDHFLPRSVLSVMNIWDILELLKSEKFPLDACLANVIYFVKTFYTTDELSWNLIHGCLFEVNSLIEKFFLLNKEFQDIENLNDADCTILWEKMEYYCGLVFELFDKVADKPHSLKILFCSVTIVVSMLNTAYEFYGKSSSKFNQISKVYEKILKSLFSGVIDKLKFLLSYKLPFSWRITNKLTVCSQLLEYNIKDSNCALNWKNFIKTFLLKEIGQLPAADKFQLFSACDVSHHPLVGTWINEKIFSEVEDAIKHNNFWCLYQLFEKSSLKYKNIYEMIVHEIWPQNDEDVGIMLSFILTQPLLPKVIKLFYEKSVGDYIDGDCRTKYLGTMSLFESIQESLFLGNIEVGSLKQILSNSEQFVTISNIVCKTEKKVVEEMLNVRKREIEYYGERNKEVRILLDFCQNIASEEIKKLEQQMEKNVNKLILSDICEPSNCLNEQPKLKVFNVDTQTLEMINFLKKNRDSIVLENIWQNFMSVQQPNADLTTADIISNIFRPTEKSWKDLVESLDKGDISLYEIDKKFGCFKDEYTKLLVELKKSCGNDVANKRCQQIKNYHQLKKYKKGAKTMLNLKSKFKLSGDFSKVETVADMDHTKDMWLDNINDELVNEFKILEGVDSIKIKCLDVFIEEKKFVDWMKTSLSGPREVKVLVDLALISAAGQGDMEVERVSCLHAAATAYSPLIYDLKQEMGFHEFFPLCRSVWNVADNDGKIATKFKDSARQLDWLIRLKESHGSVEVSALDSASAINAKGIFTIGNLPSGQNSALTLETVVRLKIHLKKGERDMEDEIHDKLEEEKWKEYNIKQLCDLQSKLMLVAGKAHEGKEEVDDFIRMFDGILRLANVYIKLVNAGCCLFKFWQVNFFCDSGKPVFAKIYFGFDDQAKCLTGTRNNRSNFKIQEKIENLCDFMEACLKEWMGYIQNKRNKRYFLNYYTTKQIVILQNEMAMLMNNDVKCNLQELLQLLYLINNECSLDQVQEALMESYDEVENELDTSIITDDKTAFTNRTDEKKEPPSEFVKGLLDFGFSLLLAKAAEKNKKTESMEEAIEWCMDNENKKEFKSDEEVPEDENISDEKDLQKIFLMESIQYKQSLHSAVNEFISSQTKQNLHLEEEFSNVWKMFLKSSDSDFCEYLSIEHLGLFLEKLASLSASTKPHRILPHHIKKGRANLILCNQTEIWPAVLSLYASSPDLPFPKVDEILICNEETTAEEVEVLWLRAKGDEGSKIYCLVHADLLDYEVAVTAEKSLNIHCSDVKDLQLVIICSSESSGRSHITNIFDQYRVKCSPIDSNLICKYIKNYLTVSKDLESASHLDSESCCVRLIKSHQAGAGKTLKVKRLASELVKSSKSEYYENIFLTVSLHSQKVDVSSVVKSLRNFVKENEEEERRIFHFDVSSEVIEGLDYLFFNLLILGSIKDSDGYIWTRSWKDLYLIESMPLLKKTTLKSTTLTESEKNSPRYLHEIFYLLPNLTCWSPKDSLSILTNRTVSENHVNAELKKLDQMMDMKEFESLSFKRPYMYLRALNRNESVDQVNLAQRAEDVKDCIAVLTRFCGVDNPSWSELKHFVDFLNFQLAACENSVFCQAYLAPDLPGFLKFVLSFMLQMSQDFATRSLKISEESPEALINMTDLSSEDRLLEGYEMKRKWETSSHPFLFFNADGHSFTFMGFVVDHRTGNVINPVTNAVLMQNAVPQNLFAALQRNKVNLSENFDTLSRLEKLAKMGTIMGQDFIHDPDESYELTADNVKKMLAIYMRFRCKIPVIIMGETGCGKTRLVKFLCDFMKPPGAPIDNMLLMKVHGGTTSQNIIDKIEKASIVAEDNAQQFSGLETVLFFDEANTTEAIGMIKEVMCDITINGKPFHAENLKLVAACNPYRKHSEQVILQLEKAGLGYHVSANQTNDRLGRIPMRQLVYRVRPLPPSMIPLVWDFGQLSTEVEKLYINQMVHRHIIYNMKLDVPESSLRIISEILAASQQFMRTQVDECSFVSLRDVARCLKVLGWFYDHRRIFVEMDKLTIQTRLEEKEEDDGGAGDDLVIQMQYDDLSRSLVLALGVCYHACLNKRGEYREFISQFFEKLCTLRRGPESIFEEISKCQDVFLKEIEIGENIARNQALKENFFMMVVCIELRIPLFLVGKPGSSKSLAKIIVADAMQGDQARTKLFRGFKSVHMVSYQCSPLSTPEGIVGTFRQCAKLQEGKDLKKFVSVVVLDEVGLAEDSERMPLKTLHPLLEDGCEGDDEPKPHKKVAFVGISNWSLDPAKMNRGIFVQRGLPDEEELVTSAKGICSSDGIVFKYCEKLLKPLAKGYLELYKSALEIREFFGLRDFYSLIKMVFCKSKMVNRTPTWSELKYAIMRNFGGLESVKPLEAFKKFLRKFVDTSEINLNDTDSNAASLIRERFENVNSESEDRYLLILTDNYAALNLLQHELLQMDDASIIFGSSFPKDQEYTQVCRNINRIKICMETGRTVVLLNLENLYESLYDALNQYYITFGDQRFVDLGLGTQRVKCRVHKSFRLVVVAEKQIVYENFPIPLINRLEKHYLAMGALLEPEQIIISEKLIEWAQEFTCQEIYSHSHKRKHKLEVADVFVGFHGDAPASLVLQACKHLQVDSQFNDEEILKHCQHLLLQCAVPESIFRLTNTKMSDEKDVIYKTYFEKQKHSSIKDFIEEFIIKKDCSGSVFAQITTHSRLLLKVEIERMFPDSLSVQLLSLQSFGTEQQFCRALKSFFSESTMHNQILLIQCDSGDRHADLIACTRFNISNEFSNCEISFEEKKLKHVLLVIQLPRIKGGCFIGFQGGKWMSYHIDDLQQNSCLFALMSSKQNCTISSLFDLENIKKVTDARRFENEKEEEEEDENYNGGDDDDEYELGRIELNKLIENCIHGAAALLKSPSNGELLKSRKTEILKPLIKNLHAKINDIEETTFLDALRARIVKLLREKEETVQFCSTKWLANDVASFEAVCNSGTLSHSFVQYLEEKITPILGYILAYCDANFNMDLLESPSKWIKQLWIAMFNDIHVTLMKYSDIQTISHRTEVGQFDMKNFGLGSFLITGNLPFSWIIKGQLDKLISQFQQTPNCMVKDEADINITFQSCGIGKLLFEISEMDSEVEKQIFDLYLDDFVKMVYKPASQTPSEELQLVAKDLRVSVLGHLSTLEPQYSDEDIIGSVFADLSKIHVTYNENRLRYKLFTEFASCFPEGVQMLHGKISEMPDRMTLDYVALTCCQDVLSFSKDGFKNDEDISKWTSKVKTLTPVIEHLLDHLQNTDCAIPLDDHQCSWNRICILQIFIDHMSSPNEYDKSNFIRLGMVLGDKADLKKLKTFEKIQKFLSNLNENAMEKYLKKNISCCVCKKYEASKLLLCSHQYCDDCLDEIKEFHQNKCHECNVIIGKNSIKKIDLKKESLKNFNDYKRRTNSFFMSLVSEMCFAGGSPPEKDVIEKLLEYVVYTSQLNKEKVKTRDMELDSNDPTPVVRSFLLQLLLRYEMDLVKDYLKKFFDHMCKIIQSNSYQIVELGALCQHCLEDHYSSLGSKQSDLTNRLSNVMAMWKEHNVKNILDISSNINIEMLQNTALLKWGLTEFAEGLYRCHVAKDLDPSGLSIIKSLSDYTAFICSKHEPVRIFLMKLLVHKYSWNVLIQLSTNLKCQWLINSRDVKDSKVLLDYFIVCGEGYLSMKKSLFQAILAKDPNKIKKEQKKNEYNFVLAVFQQFTLSYTSADLKIFDTDTWGDFITNDLKINDKDLVLELIKNKFICLPKINPNMTDEDRILSELVFHYFIALKSAKVKNRLINPILLLMEQPDMMTKSYLPAMPHDEVYEVLENLAASRNSTENTTFYSCPNKHLYVIGNCGQPAEQKTCPSCGSVIGGVSHQLAQGNAAFNLQNDETQPGHILGQPHPSPPHSIREMSPLQTAITRIFIHISLYIGSFSYDLSKEIIKLHIESNEVHEFFWKHLKEDLKTIQTAINKNSDDVLIVLHEIIHNLFVKEIKLNKKLDWTLKKERAEWEREFAQVFISSYTQNMDSSVEAARKRILESGNHALCPLMKKVYELDADEGRDGDSTDVQNYAMCQELWKFRVKISLENLLMDLQNLASNKAKKKGKKDHGLLQYFLEKNYILKEICRLPNIYALQCKLITRLNRCISASEAETFTISEFLNSLDDDEKKEFENLFQDFFHVWDIVRSDLMNFAFQGHAVPKEYLEVSFGWKSKIGVSLPTMHGWGICSMAVIHYLVHQQNQVLEVYGKETGTSTRQPIALNDCTPAHFVSYNPLKDLNTLLLSNCTYTFKVGESTKVSYDYQNLQKQIVSRFLYGKPLLQIPKYFISFKEDLNVAIVFAELERKIPQMHANVVDMLGKDFRTLADVSEALACLNIVIEFIISVGQHEETNVVEFMTNSLKMKNSFSSFPSMTNLQFKHVKSAWLHLSLAKAKLQAKNGQSAFASVDSKYKKIMSDEVHNKLIRCFHHVDVPYFASILFECIILQLTVTKQSSEDDGDGIDNSGQRLQDVLLEFLSFKNLEGSIKVIENGKFPEEILVGHCLDVWFAAAEPGRRYLIEL